MPAIATASASSSSMTSASSASPSTASTTSSQLPQPRTWWYHRWRLTWHHQQVSKKISGIRMPGGGGHYSFTSLLSLKDFEDGDILMMSPISHQRLKSIFWRMFEREYVTYEPAMFDEQFLEKGSIGGKSCQGFHLLVLKFLTWFDHNDHNLYDLNHHDLWSSWIIIFMIMITTNIPGLPSMKYFFKNCFPLSPTCGNVFTQADDWIWWD